MKILIHNMKFSYRLDLYNSKIIDFTINLENYFKLFLSLISVVLSK